MSTQFLKAQENETRLEKYVRSWLNNQAKDIGEGGIEGVLKDLMRGGCASGYVSELIWTGNCIGFYNKFQKEIGKLLANTCRDSGLSIEELFGNKWDTEDPLATESENQNLLAWFGFEETAHQLAIQNDIEV